MIPVKIPFSFEHHTYVYSHSFSEMLMYIPNADPKWSTVDRIDGSIVCVCVCVMACELSQV